MLRGKPRRAVHSVERAFLTLALPPPFTKSSSVIPPAMHSTMSKKRESWGDKGLVGSSHPEPHPASSHYFSHLNLAVWGQTDATEMPSSNTCVAKGPVPHRGAVTWMGGAPESSPM